MRRILVMLAISIVMSVSLFAQNEQQAINEIKRSADYLYAMGTSTQNADEASENAKELLALEIEQWLKENVKGDYSGYVAKSKQNVAEIKTKRGSLNRAFVYVKKSDILTYSSGESVMVVNTKEEYIVSAPINVDTMRVVEPQKTAVTGALVAEPVVSQPVEAPPAYTPNEQEREMLKVSNFTEINKYLATSEREGKVSSYGKHTDATRLFGKSYLFVFDREKVLAVLRKDGDSVINISTGSNDSVANYGRCGVIWFQLKNN